MNYDITTSQRYDSTFICWGGVGQREANLGFFSFPQKNRGTNGVSEPLHTLRPLFRIFATGAPAQFTGV